ncbi:ADP-ribosylglycohydrolase family protein [Saccharothrix sp. NPDC042600]|uniref:ADP-ribosylglycohydrolase family protein n=1 Tax=Saccharothrix TaxID=2071 RepID=UPI0033DB8393
MSESDLRCSPGRPSGYLSAGVLAVLVHGPVRGHGLPDALAAVRARRRRPQPWGDGAVGESAPAIALYATAATDSPRAALPASVNHDGDSDSTAAVCGNIVGALYGPAALDPAWPARYPDD